MLKALNLKNINKSYGLIKALDNINLTASDGEFFSLLGPSGSGKTTCLKVIAGFEAPDSGIVSIFEEDVTNIPPFKRHVNTVFQDYALFPQTQRCLIVRISVRLVLISVGLVPISVRSLVSDLGLLVSD
jgi:ABC-type Fe3+/spermidine/putrescine transport system ATPase subunit